MLTLRHYKGVLNDGNNQKTVDLSLVSVNMINFLIDNIFIKFGGRIF